MSAFLIIFEFFFFEVCRLYPLRLVHEAGLLHFSVKVEISHTASPQVGLSQDWF